MRKRLVGCGLTEGPSNHALEPSRQPVWAMMSLRGARLSAERSASESAQKEAAMKRLRGHVEQVRHCL